MVTYWKSVLRTVKSSRSRFLAIFAIVALAVLFLSGLLISTPYMQQSAGVFNRDTALLDIRVVSTLGLSDEDVAAVAAIPGVGAVMPAYTLDMEFTVPQGENLTARVHSVKGSFWGTDDPNYLNRSRLTAGRWPENAAECVIEGVDSNTAKSLLGCTLTVAHPAEDSGFVPTTLTVVGTVQSAHYLSKTQLGNTNVGTGTLSAILYADETCFDLEAYTDLYLSVAGAADCKPYSKAYEAHVDVVQERVEHLGETQRLVRRDQIVEEAMAQLTDARTKLQTEEADGLAKLLEARQTLEKAKKQLNSAFAALTSGEQEWRAGKAQLAQAKADYQAEIAAAEAEIAKNEKELLAASLQLMDAQTQLDEGRAQLEAGEAQLAENKALLNTLRNTLDDMQMVVSAVEALQTMVESGNVPTVVYGPIQLIFTTVADEMEPQIEDLRKNPTPGAAETFLLQTYDLARALEAISPTDPDRAAKLAALTDEMQQVRDGYTAAQEELVANEAALKEGEQTLAASRAQLTEAQAQLTQGRKEYSAGIKALEQGKLDLAAGKITAETEFLSAEAELAAAEKKLASGRKEYEAGKLEYEKGVKELEENEATFRREIDRGYREIEDAETKLHEMEDPQWYVLDRGAVASYVSYESDSAKVGAVAKVFPLFFFLVAALVSSTTMTRMVEEERGQIGLLKALGYSNSAIAGKFLSYASAASLLGSAVGLPLGLTVFPAVLYNAYASAYHLPTMQYTNPLMISLLSVGMIFLAILAATGGALMATLKEPAAQLMRPKAPPAGKRILLERITFIWRRLPFTWKVTARNLFRYKKRLFMTLLGVAGCTALLLAALGLRDSLGVVTGKQFGEIQTYQLTLTLRKAGDETANLELADLLEDPAFVRQYAAFHTETAVLPGKDDTLDVHLVVPADLRTLPDFIDFHQRSDGKPLTLGTDSVILTEKAATLLGLQVGDKVTVRDNDQKEVSLPIGGIMENYLFAYVYIPPALFESSFGRACDFNTLYVRTDPTGLATDSQRKAFAAELIQTGSVTGAVFNQDTTHTFDVLLSSIDAIVLMVALFAGALALVVLYNLTNINITERQKELATLKVLGFQRGELSSYIFREVTILTLLGSIGGLLLGKLLLVFIIQVIEMPGIMFGRTIAPPSYLIAFGVTMAFSLLVNLLMAGKLRRINMAESLKAPE